MCYSIIGQWLGSRHTTLPRLGFRRMPDKNKRAHCYPLTKQTYAMCNSIIGQWLGFRHATLPRLGLRRIPDKNRRAMRLDLRATGLSLARHFHHKALSGSTMIHHICLAHTPRLGLRRVVLRTMHTRVPYEFIASLTCSRVITSSLC